MLALNDLPSLYHPLFNAPNFRNGATDGQVLPLPGSARPQVRPAESRKYLETLDPVSVVEVEY